MSLKENIRELVKKRWISTRPRPAFVFLLFLAYFLIWFVVFVLYLKFNMYYLRIWIIILGILTLITLIHGIIHRYIVRAVEIN